MTQEEIISMACEAGIAQVVAEVNIDIMEAFAQLVETALIKQGYRKCAEGQHTTQFCGLLEEAVVQEREACAKVAWDYGWKRADNGDVQSAAVEITDAIRARGQQ